MVIVCEFNHKILRDYIVNYVHSDPFKPLRECHPEFVTLTNDVAESRPHKGRYQANVGGHHVRCGRTRLLLYI